jgi:hypothetical protein
MQPLHKHTLDEFSCHRQTAGTNSFFLSTHRSIPWGSPTSLNALNSMVQLFMLGLTTAPSSPLAIR